MQSPQQKNREGILAKMYSLIPGDPVEYIRDNLDVFPVEEEVIKLKFVKEYKDLRPGTVCLCRNYFYVQNAEGVVMKFTWDPNLLQFRRSKFTTERIIL